ncbi:MAG: YwiC-like family protein [Chloracidobacterium sp.]|nr:YwiC-like family protein [Chloracidobacterium sp.]
MPDSVPLRPVIKINRKQIAVPPEHGSWGFLFEPIVASLAIGFSLPGALIALMTIGAFLARQPLKVLIIDRTGQRNAERARVAIQFIALFGTIATVGFAGAIYLAGILPFVPFLLVLPLACIQIYFDGSRKSRGLLPELFGSVTISSSSAAILLAGGFGWPAALSLWLVMLLRLIPSIMYVRNRLKLEKGKPFSRLAVLLAHSAAVIIAAVLAYTNGTSILVALVMIFLLYRAANGLSPTRRKLKAMKIGILEVVYGVVTVLAIIIGYYSGI